jgi:soluble lytic murein transglycosylase-like protein
VASRGAIVAGLWAALAVGSAAEAGGLYRYVDPRGVIHFTNLKKDSRYEEIVLYKNRLSLMQRRYEAINERGFDPLIVEAARRQGIPPALVKAVIHAESAFDPHAVSPKGAMGLMQLMPRTAKMLGVQEPYVAHANILGGTRYLRELYDRYGSWVPTLAAYNAGPSAVDRFGGIPPYAETREYVSRVLTYYRRYHGDFAR